MSNGFIYVVDAHFIDKIEKKKSWTQVPVHKTRYPPEPVLLDCLEMTIHIFLVSISVLHRHVVISLLCPTVGSNWISKNSNVVK
jgi:hypothetical protein